MGQVKRTMAEIKLDKLGVLELPTHGKRSRYGRNTLYKMLYDRGYKWDRKYMIWVKPEPKQTYIVGNPYFTWRTDRP